MYEQAIRSIEKDTTLIREFKISQTIVPLSVVDRFNSFPSFDLDGVASDKEWNMVKNIARIHYDQSKYVDSLVPNVFNGCEPWSVTSLSRTSDVLYSVEFSGAYRYQPANVYVVIAGALLNKERYQSAPKIISEAYASVWYVFIYSADGTLLHIFTRV